MSDDRIPLSESKPADRYFTPSSPEMDAIHQRLTDVLNEHFRFHASKSWKPVIDALDVYVEAKISQAGRKPAE